MNLAKREDKLKVIEIFKESYMANPHVRFLLGDRMLVFRMQLLLPFKLYLIPADLLLTASPNALRLLLLEQGPVVTL